MRHPLDPFFNPTSVAMVGATEAARKIAGRRWKTLVESGFDGPVYPIHPTADQIRGYSAYRSLRDLPGPVDLAVIVVPSLAVETVIDECVDSGVRAVVVISGGFAESDGDGKMREARLLAQTRAAGMRMIGPNCAGIASLSANLNITGYEIPKGSVGLISQSGNLALNFSFLANRKGGGFSRQVTIGNAADIGVAALTDFLLHDPETKVVLIYLEGWRDGEGRQLIDVARAANANKPIIILNPGGTKTGRRAALSHTGALAAPHKIATGAYRQNGILQVHDVEEAWALAMSLSAMPPIATPNVCVLSDGGGHATLICDALDHAGLQAPPLSEPTRRRLSEKLPARCAIGNPVDFAGVAEAEPSAIVSALDTCLADPDIGAAVLVGHFGGYHRIGGAAMAPLEVAAARGMVDVVRRRAKPLLVHSVHGEDALPTFGALRNAGVPVSASIPVLAAVAGGLWRASSYNKRFVQSGSDSIPTIEEDALAALLARAAAGPPRWLMEPEARELLQLAGIAVPGYWVGRNESDCAAAVDSYDVPAAMKLIAPNIVHKSRAGAVKLSVAGAANARNAYRQLMAKVEGRGRILATPMIASGIEVVIGGLRDRQFGPVMMFGLGGVSIEAIDDVSFRPAPLLRDDVYDMFEELRARKRLEMGEGDLRSGFHAVADLLVRLSVLLSQRSEIAEIDLNPVIVGDDGLAIVDARIVLT
jgi:acyl-CoA synthetase (NDP forming)